jgi:uncharacterized Rossmann fold enzyme
MDTQLVDQLDFYNEFKQWYNVIKDDFNFSYQADCKARDDLSSILFKKNSNWKLEKILNLFKDRISSKPNVIVYGCGPSLEKTIKGILKKKSVKYFDNFINLTADGASVLLREKHIKIEAIFTDLDGISRNEFEYANFNIIHAHGDNIDKIKSFEDKIIEFNNVIGTTQVEPTINVINPGGFTDGDRILYFIYNLLSPFHRLYLIGMDFGNIIGRYSKLSINNDQIASPDKIKKLNYAVKLISWLYKKMENDIFFVNSTFRVEDFENLSIEDFLQI